MLHPGRRHALLYVDLDGLKHVNAAFGYPVGDEVLTQAAARLSSRIRREDFAARPGGDEFAVLSLGVADEAAALSRAGRRYALLSEPYVLPGGSLVVTASIGCRVTGLRADETAASLLSDADEAMQQVQSAGRDGVALYSTVRHDRAIRRSTVERELAGALGTDQVRLAYQPQVCLDTGRVLGVRVLGMEVVAEGVETQSQVTELAARGCKFVQGLHFSPAVPPAAIPALVLRPFRLGAHRAPRVRRRGSGATGRAIPSARGGLGW